MDLNDLAVDTTSYEDGRRLDLDADCYLRIRSNGSERARKVRERLWKPYASWKEVPPDVLDRINADWIAQGLLSEMVGFAIDGVPLVVDLSLAEDQKRVAEIIRAPRFKAFRNKVIGFAIDDGNYQAAADEALEKNSGPTPSGSSAGAGGRKKSAEPT